MASFNHPMFFRVMRYTPDPAVPWFWGFWTEGYPPPPGPNIEVVWEWERTVDSTYRWPTKAMFEAAVGPWPADQHWNNHYSPNEEPAFP
jgi:hypothetical protein